MKTFSSLIALLFLSSVSIINGFTVSSFTNTNNIISSTYNPLKIQTSLAMQSNVVTMLDGSPSSTTSMFLDNTITSNTISAATVDPTTALSQVLAGVLNTPLILAVPILAAVSVASVVAWLIVSYANPADPDE